MPRNQTFDIIRFQIYGKEPDEWDITSKPHKPSREEHQKIAFQMNEMQIQKLEKGISSLEILQQPVR